MHLVGTLPKISSKNLTPGLYTSNYGNYKIRSIKHYTQSLRLIWRSSRRNCSVQKGVFADFANLTGKHLCWSLHGDLHEVSFKKGCRPQAWKPATLLKKDSNRCFPLKFVKFLRAHGFKEHLRTTACESKPIRCIVFVKTMANITSRGKVSSNYHLLFFYSRFNYTILRHHSWPHWQKF